MHLVYADTLQAVRNIKTSDSQLVPTTHFLPLHRDANLVTGRHHPLNRLRPPFEWPQPLAGIIEYRSGTRRGTKSLSI
ncbi:MAG: hypothetical protein IIC60_12910 [Proteobacteria bacterium]|nr:hypothetical protein [Pseudomonadota bacterium]